MQLREGGPTARKYVRILLTFALGALALAVLTPGAVGASGSPNNSAPPTLTGVPEQGSNLTTSDGTWSGNTPMTFTYEWQGCNSGGGKCRSILGATSKTYIPTAGDVGRRLRSQVTASNSAGSRSEQSVLSDVVRADATAPSAPGNPQVTGTTQTTLTLAWTSSTDGVGVAGYGLYRDAAAIGTAQVTSYTFAGLACGRSYVLSVDAYDAAGNRSAKSSVTAVTGACPQVADTQAPSTPTGLAKTGSTSTSISISWTASSDNVGVVGYGKYQGKTLLTTGAGTAYTYSGLTCGTSYALGVDAVDAAGNRSGKASLTASTSACAPTTADTTPPSVPDGQQQTGATETTITMSWSPSTDNVGVTGYNVWLNNVKVGSTTGTSYTYTGLLCGTTYTVGLEAFDAAGNVSNRAFASGSMTTGACSSPPPPSTTDTQPPTAPTSLTPTASSATSISLTWAPSTDNVGVVGYGKYEGGLLLSSPLTFLSASTGTSYTFSGLTCGTAYVLGIDAVDAAGNRSPESSMVAATAACADTQSPTPPSGLIKTGATATSISISWSAATDNVGVTGYGEYRDGALVGTGSGTTYTYSGLTCGTSYTLAVDATDAAGNRSPATSLIAATTACPDTQAPTAPTGLTSTSSTATSISVAWIDSTDNIGVTGYGLYNNGAPSGTAATTTYTFSALTCGTSYTLAVDATDAAGNRSAKTTMTASTSACVTDTTPPSVPSNMAQTGATQTSITTSWSPSADNVGVVGYRIYTNDVLISTIAQTTYTLTGLTCGTTYTIGLEAIDAAGNASSRSLAQGPESTSACASTDTTAPSTPTALVASSVGQTSITLSWAASTDNVGVSGYGRYLNGTLLSGATGTSYTFTGLGCGTTYALGVDAYDAAGNRSTAATLNTTTSACTGGDTTAPTTPTGLATSGITQTTVTLNWTASTDNVGVTGYGRYRDGALLSSAAGTTYTFSGLTCGTTYALGVDAYDAAGNRSARSSVNATTSACSTSGATLFLSPSGSDSNPCTQSAPCRSFNRGYSLAQLGQTVEVAGGSYPGETFSAAPKSGTGVVTFRPAAGASVSMTGEFRLDGQNHIEVQNMSLGDYYIKSASDVTLRNITTAYFFVRVSTDVRIIGGSVGPSQNSVSPTIGGYDASTPSKNILVDGVLFHDIGRQLDPTGHVECLFVQESSGVTIRNSKFRNCDVMDMYVNPIFGGQVANLTVENNWFDQPRPSGYYAFDTSIQPNLRIAYNSWGGTFRMLEGAWTNATVIGNVGSLNNCSVTGVTWDHNVWDNQKCSGSTDIVAPSGFVDESNFNLHLTSGAAAINRGDPASYPSTDIDGQSRPMGGAPDAGADEAG